MIEPGLARQWRDLGIDAEKLGKPQNELAKIQIGQGAPPPVIARDRRVERISPDRDLAVALPDIRRNAGLEAWRGLMGGKGAVACRPIGPARILVVLRAAKPECAARCLVAPAKRSDHTVGSAEPRQRNLEGRAADLLRLDEDEAARVRDDHRGATSGRRCARSDAAREDSAVIVRVHVMILAAHHVVILGKLGLQVLGEHAASEVFEARQ